MSGVPRQGGITIDVSMLSTGVYLLRTVTENGTNRQFRWLKQ
ncbi:MAG: T9SS type A sorting domain-containing protein [Flavobacteriales bacterium]|nr:T9SS type A sorting domain-containing protein [Flavobacteriales bacterium]